MKQEACLLSEAIDAMEWEYNRRIAATEHILNFTTFTKSNYYVNWHHELICQKLDQFVSGEIKRLIISMPPQNGKALKFDTPIPTPSGWTTIGELKPGDKVFSDTGNICKVIAVSPLWKNRKVYKVSNDSGDFVYADAEHEWLVRLDRKHPSFLLKTTEYLANRTSPRNPLLRQNGALKLANKELPIDPYVLGVWLGDGRNQSSAMCSKDQEIINEIIRIEGEINVYENRNGTINFRPGPHYRHGAKVEKTLQYRLRKLNLLHNKHIPISYLRSSIKQRLELLQGLIDTDGYVSKQGQIEFCSINKKLAEDVKELVDSLGVKASIIIGDALCNGKDCGLKYRVMFYMKDAARLKRKAERTKNGTKQPGSYLTIEFAGYADTVCIQVDSPSHQFLCGKGMLPTHNSELVSRRLPAFLFGKNPDCRIISCSYSADLAQRMNRDVQRIIDTQEYHVLFPDVSLNESNVRAVSGGYIRNSDIFEIVGHDGSYRSCGIGGGITGMSMDYGIVDDFLKNREEAESLTIRNKIYEWYTDVLGSRDQGDSSILITATRWHQDDLIGRLLDKAEKEDDADQWEVINLPALSEEYLAPYDHRTEPEQPLWPWKYTLEWLKKKRANVPVYTWLSLYQQRPSAAAGNLVKKEQFKYCELAGDVLIIKIDKDNEKRYILQQCKLFQTCDPAASTKTSADFFTLGTWAQTPDNNLCLIDLIHTRLETPDQVPLFWQAFVTWRNYTKDFKQWVATRGLGIGLFQTLKKEGLPVDEIQEDTDKVSRFIPAATRISTGTVFFLDCLPGLHEFETELLGFPNAAHDDLVDMVSLAVDVMLNEKIQTKFDISSMFPSKKSTFLTKIR